ncbi:Acid phosphatase [Lachnellula suecica]|uniref:Purple acid phosphatase n=1 Tax=Lachnellula suecica TaxID=602035 RepID=A0A8T9CIX6_9HELO|nr:Acid phosphatase [Lachnellula suecica]
MRFIVQLLAVATASFTGALAQYDDGYETVSTSTTPVQMRVAYAGPSAMMVSWNTFSQLPNPTVMYGTSPGSLTQTASSSVSVTYATSLTYNNHVNITGLQPFTTYYYLPQYSNTTTPYTFTTSRPAGDMTPYTVGVVVDLGTMGALGLSSTTGSNGGTSPLAVNEQTTIASIAEQIDSFEFMVHAGDIAYADYWLKEEIENYIPTTTTAQGAQVYESILNAFYDEMLNITSVKAYMVAAGNHEANCDNGGTTNKTSGTKYTSSICMPGQTNFTGYMNHWRMPSGPSGGLGNFWYSYDYGMAHFVILDTETDLGNGLVGPDEGSPEYGGPFGAYNQQINWLTNDLASVNRTNTPWIVVFGHRGWYLSVSGSVCANCQTAFEKILWTYGVDLYINGHAHVYERTAPVYNNVIDPNGLNNPNSTLYITTGAAGHYDGLDTFTATQPYSAYRANTDYSWTTISFADAQHMTVSTMWSANNTVFDSATLYRTHVFNTTNSNSSSSSSVVSSTSSLSPGTSSTLVSTSTSSGLSSVSTSPTSTTNTATGTSSSVYPTYTNFNGKGALYVYSGGILMGDIGSAGTWYNTPGQNTATYTALPLYPNNTAFYLEHSPDYCSIGSDASLSCSLTSTAGATVFGQTADGNLTYNGQEAFYASSAASSGAKPTVYATSLPVSLNIVWGGTTSISSSQSTSQPSSASSTSSSSQPNSVSSTSLSGSSSASGNATSSSSTIGSSSLSSSSGVLSSVVTVTYITTQSASTVTYVTTQSGSLTTITVCILSCSVDYLLMCCQSTQVSPTTFTQVSTYTTTQSASTETDFVTATQTAVSTETDISSVTTTQPASTVTQTASTVTQIAPASTVTQSASTVTLPASTVTLTAPASTVTQSASTVTLPASTVTQTQPASTVTQPASTVTYTQHGSVTTITKAASTITTTQKGSSTTVTFTLPTSTVRTTLPASTQTVTYTQPASTVRTTLPPSTTTFRTTLPASTVTLIKDLTTTKPVTVTTRKTIRF